MADQTSSLIVRLIDQVTGPAKAVGRALAGITKAAKKSGVTGMEQLDAAITRNNRRVGMLRSKMVDAVATLYLVGKALKAPIDAARDFETRLVEIGNKSGATKEQLTAFGQEAVAASKKTNQFTGDLLNGADILIGAGMDFETAAKSISTIGMAATATGASIDDLSKLANASIANLKVPVEQLELAFDKLAQAGKMGGFELRDMAQYFPDLGAAYATFGYEGVAAVTDLGAALQIVRKSTGDASQAANAVANLLQKARAPLTGKKFKEFGIDIRKELEKGLTDGKTPFDVMVEQTRKAMAKGAKLEDLFSDKQVLEAMRPLLAFYEDYIKLRDEAGKAEGVVLQDFFNKMETNAERLKAFQITMDNLALSVGNALLPALTQILKVITPFIEKISEWAEKHPKLTAAIVGGVGGLLLFNAALIALRYTTAVGWGGLLSISKGLVKLSGLGAIPGLGLGSMLGIAAGIAAIGVAVGAWAYINWDELTSGWEAFKSQIKISDEDQASLARTADQLKEMTGIDLSFLKMEEGTGKEWGAWLGQLANTEITNFTRSVSEAAAELQRWKSIGEQAFSGALFRNFLQDADMRWAEFRFKAKDAIAGVAQDAMAYAASWGETGRAIGVLMVEGIKLAFEDLMAWFASLPSRIIAAIGKIDLSGILKWPSLPSWLGGGGGEAAPAAGAPAKKARGGPVTRGVPYIVGERRPEIFTPSQNGYISQVGKGGGGSPTISPTFNISIAGNADATTVEKIRGILRDEVRTAFRGVYADAGMRFA